MIKKRLFLVIGLFSLMSVSCLNGMEEEKNKFEIDKEKVGKLLDINAVLKLKLEGLKDQHAQFKKQLQVNHTSEDKTIELIPKQEVLSSNQEIIALFTECDKEQIAQLPVEGQFDRLLEINQRFSKKLEKAKRINAQLQEQIEMLPSQTSE